MTDQIKHGDSFNVGSIKVTGHATPCHTQDSICFFAEEDGQRAAFPGDTLFVAGCGRFFEGGSAIDLRALSGAQALQPRCTKRECAGLLSRSLLAYGLTCERLRFVAHQLALAEQDQAQYDAACAPRRHRRLPRA